MPSVSGTFGAHLSSVRQMRERSRRSVAAEIGVEVTTITRLEELGVRPTPEMLMKLVDALNLDIVEAVNLIDPYRRLCQRYTTHMIRMGTGNEDNH